MQEVIIWCNSNQGFISAILSILAILISFIAVLCTICSTKRQNRIALFEKRQKVFDDIEDFVKRRLPAWELPESDDKLFFQYSNTYIKVLFNKKISAFFVELKKSYEKVLMLWGDFEYAKKHGTCHEKSESEIEEEIHEICNRMAVEFSVLSLKILKTIKP